MTRALPRAAFLATLALAASACGSGGAAPRTSNPDAVEPTTRIRKQVGELKPADLARFSIWEFALDEEGEPGQDEETVKPRPDLETVDPEEGLFIVRAELVAGDGTRFDGYVTAAEEDHVGSIQPTIVTDRGQVNFWYGGFAPTRAELEREYRILGKTAGDLFPVRYRALVPSRGAGLEGRVPAFLHFVSVDDQRIVSVR